MFPHHCKKTQLQINTLGQRSRRHPHFQLLLLLRDKIMLKVKYEGFSIRQKAIKLGHFLRDFGDLYYIEFVSLLGINNLMTKSFNV